MNNTDTNTITESTRYFVDSPQRIGLTLLFIFGVILSITVFFLVRTWEKSEIQTSFERSARSRFISLQTDIVRQQEIVNSIAGLFSASQDITRKEFRAFVQDALSRHPNIQGLSWNPLIKHSERTLFTEKAHKDGFGDFQITELNSNGQRRKSAIRNEYVVVYYIESYSENEEALGFDIASHPGRLEAIQQARDTGKAVITERIKLVQEKEGSLGYLLFRAIYQKGVALDTVAERREHFVGLAVGVFRFSDWIPFAMRVMPPMGIEFWLSDQSAPVDKQFLHFHSSRTREQVYQPAPEDRRKAENGLHWRTTIDVLGREWSFLFAPAPAFLKAHRSWQVWVFLVAGLSSTVLLSLYLFSRSQLIDRLANTNAELLRQIADRRQAEEALRESEERFRSLAGVSPVGIFQADRNGNNVYANPRWCEISGLSAEDSLGGGWASTAHPEDHERIKRNWLEMVSAGGPWREEWRIQRANGDTRWVTGEAVPQQSSAGVVEGYVGFIVDITERKQSEDKLREAMELEEKIISESPIGISIYNEIGQCVAANDSITEMVGATKDQVLEQNYNNIESWKNSGLLDTAKNAVKESATKRNELRVTSTFGKPLSIDYYFVPFMRRGAVYLMLMANDITERKQTEKALQESEQRFRTAGKVAYDLIYEWDVATDSLEWFGDVDRILGYQQGEISKNIDAWLGLIHPEDINTLADAVELHRTSTDAIRYEYRVRHRSGEYRHWSDHGLPLLNDQGRPYRWIGVCKDITAQKEHQRQLEYIAHYDTLTGLPNRVLLVDRLHQAMVQGQRRGQQLAVVYIDLDGFKAVNDAHGHDAGDRFLAALAHRLKQALREGDTIARLGGDEFVAVLLDIGEMVDYVPLLKRLLHATSQPVHMDDRVLQVSASLGVTFYPQAEEVDADRLLRQSDQAMYQAKLAGKNRYHIFDTEHDRTLRGRHASLERIREALEEREFLLYYQPKVNMRTGDVVGAEALIRWHHPEQGLLSPICFLPVIEDQPLAVELGEWVIDTVLSQIETWQAHGLDMPVSVNIGARQLQHPDFVENLGELLVAHPNIKTDFLELEVLETSALEDMFQVSQIMDACKEIGVSFALDDFGTGYSSLTYLKHLPAASLKIDRAFVRDMLDDPDDLAILEGILGMSAAFRRKVIAEGVETREHGELLLQLGCDLAQGYGIARPMRAEQLTGWIADWQPYPSWKNQHRINRDDLSLLFASVEHRAWIRALEEHLRDKHAQPPPLQHNECRFGLWLNGEGKTRYGAEAVFQPIESLHGQVHRIGEELCELRVQGRQREALSRLDSLHELKDALLKHLHELLVRHQGENE